MKPIDDKKIEIIENKDNKTTKIDDKIKKMPELNE